MKLTGYLVNVDTWCQSVTSLPLPFRVVRHLDVSSRHWGRRDRFRLQVRGGGQVGGREIWAELRGGEEEGGGGGGEEEEERRMKRKRGVEERKGQQRALSPLSPLLVPTHTHMQLPTCTGESSTFSPAPFIYM